ncbi:MAG: M1 family aminopeptidase [Kofleriaceae bacterium]
MRRPLFRSLPLLVLALAACGDDPSPTGAIAATVSHYDYRLDLESRAAAVDVELMVDTAGDCLTLPMRAEALAGVTLGGEAIEPTIADGAATLCGRGWAQGTALTLHAELTVPLATLGESQVGFSLAEDRRDHPFWFLISWVGGCDRFGPCDAAPDRFATYRFTVDHAAGVTVRCPGQIDEVSATQTVCDFGYDGGPTYSTFGLIASSGWTVEERGAWDGIATTIYDTGSLVPGQIDDAYHAGMLAMMADLFGPYPYGDELRVLTGPTYWSGFEHPGNIVLDDNLANPLSGSLYADPVAHVLDHEIAHQWAGDQTTLAGTYDFVWKEAMAEYLAYLHEDATDPVVAARTARAWKRFADGAGYYPVPEEQPALFDYYGEVYGPGPMVLFRQLEVMTSRQAVIDALASVLGSPSTLSVDALQAALETTTGLDLDAYVDAWVRGTGAPVWPEVAVSFAAGTLSVTHTNATTSAGPCRFHVGLYGAGDGDELLVEVDLADGASQSLPATPGFEVATVVLDPLAECLVYEPAAAVTAPAPRRQGFSPWRAVRH